jgi:hypothetical protein
VLLISERTTDSLREYGVSCAPRTPVVQMSTHRLYLYIVYSSMGSGFLEDMIRSHRLHVTVDALQLQSKLYLLDLAVRQRAARRYSM